MSFTSYTSSKYIVGLSNGADVIYFPGKPFPLRGAEGVVGWGKGGGIGKKGEKGELGLISKKKKLKK